MKKNIIILLIAFLVVSCTEDRWKTTAINKFLDNAAIIDTTRYGTTNELLLKGNMKQIIMCQNRVDYYDHFEQPQVADNEYVFIEKEYLQDKEKNILIKLNKDGKAIDSLIINKYSAIINSYIIEKDSFISWFIDNNKAPQKLENINYFLKSDTVKIKSLVKSLVKSKTTFYASSEYSSDFHNDGIDTCNYIIAFKNNKPLKFNYTKRVEPNHDLKIENNSSMFSSNFKEIDIIPSEKVFKIDNFFANTHESLIRGNKIEFNLYINGGGYPKCNLFRGTYFITLLTRQNLKLKKINQTICDDEDIHKLSKDYNVYTNNFLNFYMIKDINTLLLVKK